MEDIKNFLDSQNRLTLFPAKKKKKIYALIYLASKLNPDTMYSETRLNETLNQWHSFNDPATLRRELYNFKFINRDPSGSSYWLEKQQPTLESLIEQL